MEEGKMSEAVRIERPKKEKILQCLCVNQGFAVKEMAPNQDHDHGLRL
jgi:hypothetical protein